jgi:1,4-alpha-glucan branching enzyme
VFRWEPAAGQGVPAQVELVGSFTGWKKLPLVRSAVTGTWQLTIADIPSNRTHHYMLLADDQPVSDKNCDGLAVPTEAVELQYALTTPRGPRVLMLFAQTK